MRHLVTLVAAVVAGLVLATTATASPAEKVARTITALWSCQDAIGQKRTKAENIWQKHSPGYRKWQLRVWKGRLEQCRQWNWQAFLTPVERAVLMCETQMNWRHNSGTYQGAPGFYRGSWDAFRPAGFPSEAYNATPWQQTIVMRLIRARYAWSGWGCYTHGGYRSHL